VVKRVDSDERKNLVSFQKDYLKLKSMYNPAVENAQENEMMSNDSTNVVTLEICKQCQ
jgi:hypothetical protein